MTTAAPPTADDLSGSRRAVVAPLVADVLAASRDLAALYQRLATTASPAAIRADLAALGHAKTAQVAALEGLAGALGAVPGPPARGADGVRAFLTIRGEGLAAAFQAERVLESVYRDLLALLDGSALLVQIRRLADEAGAHRQQLLRLYLRYS